MTRQNLAGIHGTDSTAQARVSEIPPDFRQTVAAMLRSTCCFHQTLTTTIQDAPPDVSSTLEASSWRRRTHTLQVMFCVWPSLSLPTAPLL